MKLKSAALACYTAHHFKMKENSLTDWHRYCKKTKKKFPKIIKEHKSNKNLINSYVFVDKINSILDREDKVVGMTCKYKYPNEDSFMFVTPGPRYQCPMNLTCTITN